MEIIPGALGQLAQSSLHRVTSLEIPAWRYLHRVTSMEILARVTSIELLAQSQVQRAKRIQRARCRAKCTEPSAKSEVHRARCIEPSA